MRIPDFIYKIARASGAAGKPVFFEFPKEVDVGLTNYCNLRCSFCFNHGIKKNRGFMEESLFKSLADCLSDKFQAKTILGIGLFGEDTMHPKFADFLMYASSKGLKINLSTNFVLVDKTISQAIIDSRANLVEISFYTLNKEGYNKTVGKSVYENTLKNIHSFLSLAENSYFKGAIRIRPFEDFYEAGAYQKEFYQKYPRLNFDEKEPKTMANWAGFLTPLNPLNGVYLRIPCSFPFSRLAVDWDGEARLCCESMLADDVAVGYASGDLDFYKLWNSQKMNDIREKFSKIDYKCFPSCRNCYFSRRYF